ncbi:hypothetical protein H6P81_001358 [Aristolochia fimbriata]|uniref:Uncharacterized protein n=1 Tax=Aristolochia fimbriata TaxID=158543 RepID=A0AAV7F9C0_ARIFI|nr:hypothetical protein H6P81_001358 [Aristolochia fimbriata]
MYSRYVVSFVFVSSSVLLNLYFSYLFFSGGGTELSWSKAAATDAEAAAAVYCSGHGDAFLDAGDWTTKGDTSANATHATEGPIARNSSPIVRSTLTEGLFTSAELEQEIRRLHSVVGNANTTGRYIVFGIQ